MRAILNSVARQRINAPRNIAAHSDVSTNNRHRNGGIYRHRHRLLALWQQQSTWRHN